MISELALLLQKFFVHRSDVFCKFIYSPLQRRFRYDTVFRPLTIFEIQRHLDHQHTIGVLPVCPQSRTVKWCCWDIDTQDLVFVENIYKRIKDKFGRVLLENSGFKGFHIWLLFEKPIPLNEVWDNHRKFIQSPLLQFFPERLEILDDGYYELCVKMPLGKNFKTGGVSFFLDDNLEAMSHSQIIKLLRRF